MAMDLEYVNDRDVFNIFTMVEMENTMAIHMEYVHNHDLFDILTVLEKNEVEKHHNVGIASDYI
jgi:hypothetical protein